MTLLLVVLILVVLMFAVGAVWGAPYVPIWGNHAASVLKLLDLPKGATIIDLGAGDGKFALAAALAGYQVICYEINPILCAVLWLRARRFPGRITVHCANFWQVALPPADAIYTFLIARYMSRLDTKLQFELTKPTPVASYVFEIPGRKARQVHDNTFLYEYPA